MKRKILALVAVASAFLVLVAPARAHEETALHALSVLDRVAPESPGVSFRVVQLTQPVLVATNGTRKPLVIIGPRGEPFLRLHEGVVETNLNSPLTYVSRDPGGHARAPGGLDVEAAPRWHRLERDRSWSWFDPRIRFRPGRASWQVDARLGSRPIVLSGSFEPLEGHGHFVTALEDPPSVPDLELELLDGTVPALFVRNETGDVLNVVGRSGEPFLRIGPNGVFGNLRSPDYYLGGNQTIRVVPASADPSARPRWKHLSQVPIWTWLEFRARLPVRLHQRSLLGDERRTVLEWVTPMNLGGRSLDLDGRLEWIPPVRPAAPAPDDGPSVVLIVVVTGAALLALATLVRRRRPVLS